MKRDNYLDTRRLDAILAACFDAVGTSPRTMLERLRARVGGQSLTAIRRRVAVEAASARASQ